jgi:hypothetical protein
MILVAPVASAVGVLCACGGNSSSSVPGVSDEVSTDASTSTKAATATQEDAGSPTDAALAVRDVASTDAPAVMDSTVGVPPDARPDPTKSFVRIANWAPDAPRAGVDVCLRPLGTTQWIGPLLAQRLAAGVLGQGGANGIQFPWVTEYLSISPGQYDLRLVAAGSGDCTMGILPTTTGLPALVAGEFATFAVTGEFKPIDEDASAKISAFFDDISTAPGRAALRFINASPGPEAAALRVGTGSLADHTFVEIFADVEFGTASAALGDGGATDPNGYASIAPLSGVEFSAYPVSETVRIGSAAHVTASAGVVETLLLIHGENGGLPPQFLACTDNGPSAGALSACTVLPHT